MTENLAERGEGLAGLVAELQALADRTYAPGGPGHEEFEKGLRTAYLIAAGMVQKLAALEAAAPASTPHITAEMVQQADACWSGHGPGRWSEHLAKVLNNLLATPSPQAPPEQESSNAFSPTSAREQSAATASAIPSVGDEYNLRVYKVEGHWYVDIDTEKPHSGLANGATPELAMDSAKEMLTHMRDCEVKDGRRTCE